MSAKVNMQFPQISKNKVRLTNFPHAIKRPKTPESTSNNLLSRDKPPVMAIPTLVSIIP